MPKFPPKPPAPSVHEKIAPAIERSRALLPGEKPMTRQEVVRDILRKLDLPLGVKARLKERHKLD